jgi:hypothetical protein
VALFIGRAVDWRLGCGVGFAIGDRAFGLATGRWDGQTGCGIGDRAVGLSTELWDWPLSCGIGDRAVGLATELCR